MDGLQADLAKVEAEIEALGLKLEKVEAEVETARARKDEAEVTQLRTKEEQLRTKEGQLRTKEDKLRTEKLLLLQSEQGVLCASVGPVEAGSVGSLLTQHVCRPTRAANEHDWRGCRHGKASADARCGEGVTQQFRAAQDVGKVPVFGR
jgi:hypothetical protein